MTALLTDFISGIGPAVLTGLSVLALLVVVLQMIARIRAERSWRSAVRRRDSVQQMLRDFEAEQHLRGGTTDAALQWRREYLARALSNLLRDLEREDAISTKEAHQILNALQQPSESGRRQYARKLLHEVVA